MRFLDQAIEEKLYESSGHKLRIGKWSDFEKACNQYPLYLFGTGEGTDYFLQRYGNALKITAVVDNDKRRWNHKLNEFITYPVNESVKVVNPDLIKAYGNECVILITSIRYCNDIFDQLKKIGAQHIFSLLHMEANRRMEEGWSLNDSLEDERVDYAAKCTSMAINDKKILLARDGLAGHGKQILVQLAAVRSDLELVWIVENDSVEHIPGVRLISQSDWKSYIKELETAKIWIFGDMIPEFAIKRPEQIYIHVKHWASITLKSFYFHLKEHLKKKSIYDYYRHNTDAMDYCMVGSDFDEKTCRTGFDFDGKFIRVGSPRSDVLFQQDVREKVYQNLGIDYKTHTVLYAPTFRARNKNSLIGCMRDVDLDFELLKDSLEKRFGGKWMILLRIHPDVASESKKIQKKDYVLDVSDYPDSEELVAASDMMISDYSSIMFEPAFINRPVFLYAPDVDDYINNDRKLLIDYYSLPFPISKSNEELNESIRLYDVDKCRAKVERFLNEYGVHEDGHASERGAEFIVELLTDGK